MKTNSFRWQWFLLLSFLIIQWQCSGDGSASGDVDGLEITDQIDLVTASDSATETGFAAVANANEPSFPAGSPYETDADLVETHVYDEAMRPMDTVNEIICLMSQTRAAEMVNTEDYLALIDNKKCAKGEQENSSTQGALNLETWTVRSEREFDESQFVSVWIPKIGGNHEEDEEDFEIRALVEILEGVSDTNPFGNFTLNAGFYDESGLFGGGVLLSSNQVDGLNQITMVMDQGQDQLRLKAQLDSNGNGKAIMRMTGRSHDMEQENQIETQTIRTASNENYFAVEFEEGDLHCRARQEPDVNVWRYNLYADDGSRLKIDGGFSIKAVGEGEHGMHGWAGYHGIWLPDGLDANGLQVTDDNGVPYTVFAGEGKLQKRTKDYVTLGELIGVNLQHFNHETMTSDVVQYDGTNFVKVGLQTCGDQGCTIEELESPEIVVLNPGDWFGLYSEGLGYIDFITPEVLDDETEAPYYKEDSVLPGDDIFAQGDLPLKCYSNCLKVNLTQQEIAQGDIYLEIHYTFNQERHVLQLDGQDVVLPDGVSTAGTDFQWGIRTGAMVLESLDDPSEIWSQEITYSYETGENNWNKQMALLDAENQPVVFDKPLSCFKSVDGFGLLQLKYAGEGNLHGIPFIQDTANFSDGRWHPAFSIEDGTALDCEDGNTYYTRQMARELILRTVDASLCSDLSLTGMELPQDAIVDPGLGEAPIVEAAPKVIGGILVE